MRRRDGLLEPVGMMKVPSEIMLFSAARPQTHIQKKGSGLGGVSGTFHQADVVRQPDFPQVLLHRESHGFLCRDSVFGRRDGRAADASGLKEEEEKASAAGRA